MFCGPDLIKLVLGKARFFLATEIQNVRGSQQKGVSPFLALQMEGHMARNCGWPQGTDHSVMLTAS